MNAIKFSLALAGVLVLLNISAHAQTVSNGPYYATPSWDQTLSSSTRFIVLSNMNSDAVLDRETGLVWERAPSTTTFGLADAHTHCYELYVGGRMGWRLAKVDELITLKDPTQGTGFGGLGASPALPLGHPFKVAQPTLFWAVGTTPVAGTIGRYFEVSFFTGAAFTLNTSVESQTDSHLAPAWCVRGPGGVATPF